MKILTVILLPLYFLATEATLKFPEALQIRLLNHLHNMAYPTFVMF